MTLVGLSSRCAICHAPIGDDYIGLNPFCPNSLDPLYPLSDGVVHRTCLAGHPLRSIVERASKEARAPVGGCAHCGKGGSTSPDDLVLGFLTSNPTSPLFEFNFVVLHSAHLTHWPRYSKLAIATAETRDPAKWNGQRLLESPIVHWEPEHRRVVASGEFRRR